MATKSKKIDDYSKRREMPRIVIPEILKSNKLPGILVSGNLDYYVRYGLPLINSFLKYSSKTALIINCVDFTISLANSLLKQHISGATQNKIFFTKTELSSLGLLSQERKSCYLKTIRYYIGLKIRKILPTMPLIIADIDALLTKSSFDSDYKKLTSSSIDFGIGSTYDFLNNSLYDSRKQNYLWRTIKAGCSYYNEGQYGTQALNMIVQSLFNLDDKIPPADKLKLYRAYYGDQLAILFTSLELNSQVTKNSSRIKCLGCSENDMISFSNREYGSFWIPPASKRDEKLFDLFR